jgi:FkbM family methyltransferase
MLSDIEIAQKANLKPITQIATEIGVDHDSLEPYGKYKAKIDFKADKNRIQQYQKIIDNIGYIHLDVEGMEYKVINGSSNLIDEFRPIISFEQHLEIDDYEGILSHLKNKIPNTGISN